MKKGGKEKEDNEKNGENKMMKIASTSTFSSSFPVSYSPFLRFLLSFSCSTIAFSLFPLFLSLIFIRRLYSFFSLLPLIFSTFQFSFFRFIFYSSFLPFLLPFSCFTIVFSLFLLLYLFHLLRLLFPFSLFSFIFSSFQF